MWLADHKSGGGGGRGDCIVFVLGWQQGPFSGRAGFNFACSIFFLGGRD